MKVSRRVMFTLITLSVSLLLVGSAACGDDDDDDGTGGNGGPVTFDVSMTDLAFNPDELSAAAGSEVTINLTNDGAAPHNMRIAGEDGEFDTEDDAVSDPDLIAAGETGTLEWTAPDAAGEIEFRCDIHPVEMVGTITVE